MSDDTAIIITDVAVVDEPEGKAPCGCDEDLIKEALERLRTCQDSERENREKALDDLRFVHGEQWDEELKQQRQADGRPCLTINRLPAFIDQVVGDQRQNRPAIKIRAVDDYADPTMAKIFEGLIRNIEYTSNAEAAYDVAFENAATCGIGYFRILTDYASDGVFEQDIKIAPIRNPFTVSFDPNCNEPDYSDARFAFVSEFLPRTDFEAMYPNASLSPVDGGVGNQDWVQQVDGEEHIRIAEYWYRKPVARRLVQLTSGKAVYDDELPADGEVAVGPDGKPKERMVETSEIYWCKISQTEVLEGPTKWAGKYIPIVPVLGKEVNIEGKRHLRGLIRFAKDPQRMYNYWRTATAERMAMAPKAPFLLTPEQISGYENMWQQANVKNQPYLLYKNVTGLPQPKRVEFPPVPTGEIQETQIAVDEMKATTGIFDASLGAQGNETSGRAILARQKEGDTATFAFTDNLSRGIRFAGKIILDLIPNIYDTERVVRTLGPDGAEELVKLNEFDPLGGRILNDVSVGRYDVVVSTGASYNTQRQEVVAAMMDLFQAQPALFQLLGSYWLKAMDWPGAEEMAAVLRRVMPPQAMDLKTKMLMLQEQQQEQQELAKLQSGQPQQDQPAPDPAALAKMAELEIKKAELELKKAEMDSKVILEQQKLQLDAQVEMAKLQIQQQELRLKEMQIQGDLENEAVKQTRENLSYAQRKEMEQAKFAADTVHRMEGQRANEQS